MLLPPGFLLAGLLDAQWPLLAAAVGCALLGTRALHARLAESALAWRPRVAWATAGSAGLAVAITGLLGPWPDMARATLLATGAQFFLAALGAQAPVEGTRWARRTLPIAGHAAAIAGTITLLLHDIDARHVAALAYGGGFPILALHVHWIGAGAARSATAQAHARAWEPVLLTGLGVVVVGSTGAYVSVAAVQASASYALEVAFLGVALAGAFFIAAALSAPPPAPRWLAARAESPSVGKALAHGGAALALLNVLIVVFALVATWSARVLIVVLTLYIVLAVGMEYRALRDALRRRRALRAQPREPPACDAPISIVISARDDAEALAASMVRNLTLPASYRFLLVPSVSSKDDTVALCESFAREHPGRVQVVLGTSGSKAGDLNLAWDHISTEFVMLLDADEYVEARTVAFALDRLLRDPQLGVAQGRKVAQDAYTSTLARFISVERRHSTNLDQGMHDGLGSAHFAGSAALVRKVAVDQAGGWTGLTMTEDIEFTFRLHLRTGWKIAYESRFLVWEASPSTLDSLVQQRTRWARGWMQCYRMFFPEVLYRREALGRRRAFGLSWLLLAAVSAPLAAVLPAMVFLRALGIPALLPWAVGVFVASFILPARLLGYGFAALHDPVIPTDRRPARIAELILHAYVWVLFGWIVHFQALYLELSAAPRVWYITRKRVMATTSAASPGRKGVPV